MKLLRVAIIAIIFSAAFVCAHAEDNTFKSVILGLEVTKPSDWTFTTADEYKEKLQQVGDAELQEQIQECIQRYGTTPLVAMKKYPEPFEDLSPNFNIRIKPFEGLFENADGKTILSFFLSQFQKILKDFNLVTAPIEVEISGLKAGYAQMNYSIQNPDGRMFPITSESWVIPRAGYFFQINAVTRQDEKTGTRQEIAEIMKSLKIER